VWLIYRPDLDWLKSRDAALTLTLAEKIAATDKEKLHNSTLSHYIRT
jgi:adenine-specific DNA-methyltransferase